MSEQGRDTDGTRSEDYTGAYYNDAHLGGYDNYSWESEEWRRFFLNLADRLISLTNPGRTLDVGCARGLLVQALAMRGVDATGFDISNTAIQTAHVDVRHRLRVASLTEPIQGRYDLVTCIEVLEHMGPGDAQVAIDNITAVTDRVLFSSSPRDHDEPTHINTRPTEQWVAWFAERGFHRRADADLSFLTPWAVLLERAELTSHEIVQRYESLHARTHEELVEKRQALLLAHRRLMELAESKDDAAKGDRAEVVAVREELLRARNDVLTQRDHVIALEGQATRLHRSSGVANKKVKRLEEKLERARSSAQAQRAQNVRLTKRVARLEADLATARSQVSMVRRVVRKLRGGGRG